jgi:hypothetical protein
MKNVFILGFFLLIGGSQSFAQNVVRGKVTDMKGNPIPGAKIEVKGGAESTISELDGTFSLETKKSVKKVKVYYVGLQTKVQNIKPDMLIKLHNTNWWNGIPGKQIWFISVQSGFFNNRTSNPSLGLMIGRMKSFGWYVKGVYSKDPVTDVSYHSSYWTTSNKESGFQSITGGFICRLGCPIHLYLGTGLATRKVAWQLCDGKYEDTDNSYNTIAVDLGLIMKFGRVMINGGSIIISRHGYFDGTVKLGANVGIGLCF